VLALKSILSLPPLSPICIAAAAFLTAGAVALIGQFADSWFFFPLFKTPSLSRRFILRLFRHLALRISVSFALRDLTFREILRQSRWGLPLFPPIFFSSSLFLFPGLDAVKEFSV